MKVIFVHHSCFAVEIDQAVLIFDYFGGDRVEGFSFSGKLPDYAPGTPVYLFASHSHRDHYDLDVLRWKERYPNIRYIFSKDIRISPNFLKKHDIDPQIRERVLMVAPDKQYTLDELSITTLRSTDVGVAYYVSYHGVCVYHAGDLNDWRREGAGDLINGREMRDYRKQIRKLSRKPIHFAFVPMDPRLEEFSFEGIDYFLRNTDAEYVFPMHMWQDYSGIARYKKRLTNRAMAERVMEITEENQVFVFADEAY